VGTSEAETSLTGKAECLLAIGEDKKTKLFGVAFSVNLLVLVHKKGIL